MKPWKRASIAYTLDQAAPLQWGHGDEAVEEQDIVYPSPTSTLSLQWGHGDEAVEEKFLPGTWSLYEYASMGPRR